MSVCLWCDNSAKTFYGRTVRIVWPLSQNRQNRPLNLHRLSVTPFPKPAESTSKYTHIDIHSFDRNEVQPSIALLCVGSTILIALKVEVLKVEVPSVRLSVEVLKSRSGPVCPSICRSRSFPRSNCHRWCCLKSIATAVRFGNLQAPADALATSWLPQQAPAMVFVWTFASLWSSAFFLLLPLLLLKPSSWIILCVQEA